MPHALLPGMRPMLTARCPAAVLAALYATASLSGSLFSAPCLVALISHNLLPCQPFCRMPSVFPCPFMHCPTHLLPSFGAVPLPL